MNTKPLERMTQLFQQGLLQPRGNGGGVGTMDRGIHKEKTSKRVLAGENEYKNDEAKEPEWKVNSDPKTHKVDIE